VRFLFLVTGVSYIYGFCRTESHRLSLASNSDTNQASGGFDGSTLETGFTVPRPRHDSNALLMLPAPLAANRPMMSSSSTVSGQRSSEDNNYLSDSASGSNQRLIPSPQSGDQDSYDTQRLLSPQQYDFPTSRVPHPINTRTAPPPFEYRPLMTSPSGYDEIAPVWNPMDYAAEDIRHNNRGISLTDSGPVPGPEGVRRVARPSGRRPTSQAPAPNVNRYSRNSGAYTLPPGAAPPQPHYGSPT
jgi:chitin synthase